MEEPKVSEFKSIGGQRTLVAKKQMGHSGSLPSLTGRQGMGSSSSAFFAQNTSFRQRGIMSEVVKPHRRQEVDSCKLGPEELGTCCSTLRKSASATSFSLSDRLRAKAQEAEPHTPRKVFQPVEPKVIEVYAHKPGDRPRKVTVERRRKWFEALDVENLLEERNCNFSPNWDRDFWLQLDDFNNIEYDIRTPEQWLELGQQPDGSFLPLQAKAMRFHETKGSVWEDCTVEGLKDLQDGKGNKDFLVRWNSNPRGDLEPVGRLRIVLQGEDPEVFADRIAYAFDALQKAQARIRLNFFIDNMPVDDIQTLDEDQVARVLDLSRNSAALRDVPETFCNTLVREANLDFARTMNKIILMSDPQVQKPPGYRYQAQASGQITDLSNLLDDIDIDDLEETGENPFERDVPWFSLWPVPEFCFTDSFSSVCFASLYIRPEVVSSLGEVCQENLNLMASCIYATKFVRLMKPEQFRQIQRSAITSMAQYIRDHWVVNIQKIILNNFRDVGKGWFSIHETNQDTYRQGKLKKLLAVVKNMMQDSLEFFALDSVDDYCHGLEDLAPERVVVHDLTKVATDSAADEVARRSSWFHPPPPLLPEDVPVIEVQQRISQRVIKRCPSRPRTAQPAMLVMSQAPRPHTAEYVQATTSQGSSPRSWDGAGAPDSEAPEDTSEQHEEVSSLKEEAAGDKESDEDRSEALQCSWNIS